jgi:hypothetical protein
VQGTVKSAVAAALVFALALGGAALASGETVPTSPPQRPTETVPASTRKSVWFTEPRLGLGGKAAIEGHMTTIGVRLPGYCVGDPRYEVDRVKVVERPKTGRRPFGSAVITAFIHRPEYQRVISGHEGNVFYGTCADIGGGLQPERIRLKRPASQLILYDGGYLRPHRAYPPVGTPPDA